MISNYHCNVISLKVFGKTYKTTVAYEIVLHEGGFAIQYGTEN